MPYDLAFERIIPTDNKSALELNKLLAKALIAAFPEIHDLNPGDSTTHFTQFEIDLEDELTERHFKLWAEIDEMHFGFEFWRNTLWIELGAAGDPNTRFTHVCRYAGFIVQHGLVVSSISGPETLALDKGIEAHLREYKEWTGFVERVIQIIHNKPFLIE